MEKSDSENLLYEVIDKERSKCKRERNVCIGECEGTENYSEHEKQLHGRG